MDLLCLSSYNDTSSIGLEPHTYVLYLLKSPISKHSPIGGWGFNVRILEGHSLVRDKRSGKITLQKAHEG